MFDVGDPEGVPDFIQLDHVSEQTFLENLQTRFRSGNVYVDVCVRVSGCACVGGCLFLLMRSVTGWNIARFRSRCAAAHEPLRLTSTKATRETLHMRCSRVVAADVSGRLRTTTFFFYSHLRAHGCTRH